MQAALPVPSELRLLQVKAADALSQLSQHRELLERLDDVLAARKEGNGTMQLPVELGGGFSVKGVVEDTSRVICAAGLDDLYVDLPVEKAREFVEKRIAILEKKQLALEEPLEKLQNEYELLTSTLQKALQSQAASSASSA
ncbi:hypothetical protein JCM10213_004104 [Rhodosporidiobolus nylandii]